MLYRIVAPHFVAGVIVTGETITTAAPIVAYMRSWTVQRMLSYCIKKRWTVEQVGETKF